MTNQILYEKITKTLVSFAGLRPVPYRTCLVHLMSGVIVVKIKNLKLARLKSLPYCITQVGFRRV